VLDAYPEQRSAFQHLREALLGDDRLGGEVVAALTTLIGEYDTSIRENRFVVGGAVEHIIGSAMRAAGIVAMNRGKTAVGADITLQSGGTMSVKAAFTPRPPAIRLVNTLGSSEGREWGEPTILVIAGLGVGYCDPVMLPSATRSTGDAIVLPPQAYLELFEAHAEWLASLEVPARAKSRTTKVASYALAEEILSRDDFELLRRNRTSVAPG